MPPEGETARFHHVEAVFKSNPLKLRNIDFAVKGMGFRRRVVKTLPGEKLGAQRGDQEITVIKIADSERTATDFEQVGVVVVLSVFACPPAADICADMV